MQRSAALIGALVTMIGCAGEPVTPRDHTGVYKLVAHEGYAVPSKIVNGGGTSETVEGALVLYKDGSYRVHRTSAYTPSGGVRRVFSDTSRGTYILKEYSIEARSVLQGYPYTVEWAWTGSTIKTGQRGDLYLNHYRWSGPVK